MWSFGTTMTMATDGDSASKPTAQQPQAPQPVPKPQETLPPPPPEPIPSVFSPRSLKQLGLFFGGAGFLFLSTMITRRSVARKMKATIPRFYHQSNHAVKKMDGDSSLIALEALNLATLNVLGFGIMMTGGAAWAFDLSSVDDLRSRARKHLGGVGGRTDEEAEQEIEEWVAKVLLRKEKKEEEASSTSQKN